MSKFKKEGKKSQPAISTAALPDIVFMLLFFFLIASSIKTSNWNKFIEITQPKASELNKLENKNLVNYIYIGKPKNTSKYGSNYMLVINDKPASPEDVLPYINEFRKQIPPEQRSDIITQMTIDKDAKMGFVQDVKEQLGYAQQFKVSYAGQPGDAITNLGN